MKTKPILITIACLAVIVCVFFVVKAKYPAKPGKNDVSKFLNDFVVKAKLGNADSLMVFFDVDGGNQQLMPLLRAITGTATNLGIKVEMNIKNAKVTDLNPNLVMAEISVIFSRDSVITKNSSIAFNIYRDNGKYKIVSVKADVFLNDYYGYEFLVRDRTLPEKDIYSPITLASFKIADQLKARYDSVIWFTHINEKTYYYVVKGSWNMENYFGKDTTKEYQMGLVDPELKEIIPPQYDLIHNISGTFDGLIEVDKDHKHGFYDLNGKVVLPVEYDQIFPVKGGENLAALRKGDDYYWLKNDFTVSDKADLKIGDIISNLKQDNSQTFKNDTTDNITEFNSRNDHGSLRIPPSYLVDLNILPAIKMFKNPLRKNVFFEDASSLYIVKLDKKQEDTDNWLTAAFYSIRDYYLGGRSEFYDTKNMVVLDKKRNKVYSYELNTDMGDEEGDGGLTGTCNEYNIRPLSDSLFELKATTSLSLDLYNGDVLNEAPYYHYLNIKDGKLVEMHTNRIFSFTKFIKMDDSYLSGCYLYGIKSSTAQYGYVSKETNHLDNAVLQYMKNEIFADYNYEFKDTVWTNLFKERMQSYQPDNANVDDALTPIDKYNINWIVQKLKASPSKKLVANR